ncbi:uncharacterized protein DS421_19g664810 [Arachis hypogaea]|uniref:Uncharacterized protein n=1 Tax=Arachis hypogaea TaxID=3818 RepID=A0A6B9VAH5_ARAHY|nr:uncharacterized protein DS421_19g664810 [Arachis hypogaea]
MPLSPRPCRVAAILAITKREAGGRNWHAREGKKPPLRRRRSQAQPPRHCRHQGFCRSQPAAVGAAAIPDGFHRGEGNDAGERRPRHCCRHRNLSLLSRRCHCQVLASPAPQSERGFGRSRCHCRRRGLRLCDSDRREWFCDLWEHCRSSELSFCHLRPCCHRAPLPELESGLLMPLVAVSALERTSRAGF